MIGKECWDDIRYWPMDGIGSPGSFPPRKIKIIWKELPWSLIWIGRFEIYNANSRYLDNLEVWCEESLSGKYTFNRKNSNPKYLSLHDKLDAVAFKLRWM